jgi:hypothetical protein
VATLRLAEQGVPAALKEVWERREGKVGPTIADNDPMEIVVSYVGAHEPALIVSAKDRNGFIEE